MKISDLLGLTHKNDKYSFTVKYKNGTTKNFIWTSFQRQLAKRRKDYNEIVSIGGNGRAK